MALALANGIFLGGQQRVVATPFVPLNNPVMFAGGASLEQYNLAGETSTDRFGYTPQGHLTWLNNKWTGRLFDLQVGRGGSTNPFYSKPSNYASAGATFADPGSGGGAAINDQPALIVAAAAGVAVGKRAVYFSAGRNDLGAGMSAADYLTNFELLLNQLIAGAMDLIIVPGLWLPDTSIGGFWASGGQARAAVLDVNIGLASMCASKGNKVLFVPLISAMCNATGDQNPKTGYVFADGRHMLPAGCQAGAAALDTALRTAYLTSQVYPSPSNLAPALTGTGGTTTGITSGQARTGWTVSKNDTNITLVANATDGTVGAGVQRLTITPAATYTGNAAGGRFEPSTAIAGVAGATYRARCRLRIAATATPFSVAFSMSELTTSNLQRAIGMWNMFASATDLPQPNTTGNAVTTWDASAGLDLWLETPTLVIKGASSITFSPFLQFMFNRIVSAAVQFDISDFQVERLT